MALALLLLLGLHLSTTSLAFPLPSHPKSFFDFYAEQWKYLQEELVLISRERDFMGLVSSLMDALKTLESWSNYGRVFDLC